MMDAMSTSRSNSQVPARIIARTSQIKQVAQRVSSRLRDKRLMKSQQIQSSPQAEHSITSQQKQELVRISKLTIPEQSRSVTATPTHKEPSIVAIHATSESGAPNPQHYHPHNVDRREKRKNERINKLQAVIKQKDAEIKHLHKVL